MSIWSIGIYSGDSPLHLGPAEVVQNPVLTHQHIKDFPAVFVADPFMVFESGLWHMFFEVMSGVTNRGAIGLAVSKNAIEWEYSRIVLDEPFHLSYPYVFRWKDEYYMTPETLIPCRVRLYRAVSFPTMWTWEADLVSGAFADPSPFRHLNQWWMYACGEPYGHDNLRLFRSQSLTHGWRESRLSPVIEGNRRIARPAGRVTPWQQGVIRYAQDCFPSYGSRVRAFHVTQLSGAEYKETEAPGVVLTPDASGNWAASGMHHVDPHRISGGKWIAAVDGLSG